MNINVIATAVSKYHSLFVTGNGDLYAMGYNTSGQLGDRTTTSRATPVRTYGGTNVVAIAAGGNHSLFVTSDGKLRAMGYNSSGQLGDGTNTDSSTPIQVSGATDVVAVAAGGNHSMFTTGDGKLWVMGSNNSGQLGDGTTTNSSTPLQVPGATNVIAVAAGEYYSLFVTGDGKLWAMGSNNSGQLGDGTTTNSSTPLQVPGATNVTAVAAGDSHSLFLTGDGKLWAMGSNNSGQLGDGTTTNSSTPLQVPGATNVIAIAAGGKQSLFVTGDGTLWQVGDGKSNPVRVFSPAVLSVSPAASQDIGPEAGTLTITVANTGTTQMPWTATVMSGDVWTRIISGTSGSDEGTIILAHDSNPTSAQRTASLRIKAPGAANDPLTVTIKQAANFPVAPPVTRVATGWQHSLFVTNDGRLWAMGLNDCGQLGDGTTKNRNEPVQIANNVISVAAGFQHSLFLTGDGKLWAMGLNNHGQLGSIYTNSNRTTPGLVADNVTAVVAGSYHSLYLTNDNKLWAMGLNKFGQLGDGTTTDRTTPVLVANNVSAVATYSSHSLYVTSDGRLWCMGANEAGQLGNGANLDLPTPAHVASNVIAVAAGTQHSLYVTSDGKLWGMGLNNNGQIGGSSNSHRSPKHVADNATSMLAAGHNYSLFITTDGTLWGLGANSLGQLGDGTTVTRTAPVQVASDAAFVAASNDHSLYVANDGRLWATGANSSGQLGDAIVNNSNIFVMVFGSMATPPIITTNPVSQSIYVGQNATFTITATGVPEPEYQWQILGTDSLWTPLANNAIYSGVTTASLAIANATAGMSGAQYRCVLNNMAGDATSNPATLTVGAAPVAPVITTQPANQSVTAGQNATFAIAASGNPTPAYQWQSSTDGGAWTDVTGNATATTDTLILNAVTVAMDGTQYRCLASNSVASNITSNAATLTVAPSPTDLAQQFKTQAESPGVATITVTGALDLSLVDGVTVASGKTIVGEDAAATVSGALTLPAGVSNVLVLGVNFTTGALTITGAHDVDLSHCTFTDTPVVINGNSDNIAFSWNKFTATPASSGSAMRIDNSGEDTGILLSHNYFADGLKADIPAATNSRVVMFNNYIAATGNTTATIAGAGAQILSERNIYQGTHNPLAKQGTGKLRALNNFTNATTGTLDPGADTVFVPAYSRLMYPAGSTAPFDAAAVAALITGNAGNTNGKNSPAPDTTPNADARITAIVSGAGSGTSANAANVPAVSGGFTLTAGADNFIPAASQWYRDNFTIPGATANTYTVTSASAAHAGAYAVALTTPAGEIVASGAFMVTVGALAAPVITTHPASQTVTVGGNATFHVAATGESLSYEWRKDGAPISGATGASFTITNAQQSHAGAYNVVVRNPAGSASSNAAALTVSAAFTPPAITTQPVSKTVTVGGNVTFTVVATGNPAPTFQWMLNGNSIPRATNASHTINNVQKSHEGGYTVRVSNTAGNVTSSVATLTVNTGGNGGDNNSGGGGGGGGAPSLWYAALLAGLVALRAAKKRRG
ncbi:immunoglobulin domain-containing protein [Ereboglobus sp. PH5-5]|uniref:RCC1 domain-containing protein n=1 Tax=Ereboglobus sp. PH5-5 TaxID=2940529 RepID=UPI0024071635|nr:immunoglobulin domain-containing protein [Ereboglobus sp. PH5-5]